MGRTIDGGTTVAGKGKGDAASGCTFIDSPLSTDEGTRA